MNRRRRRRAFRRNGRNLWNSNADRVVKTV